MKILWKLVDSVSHGDVQPTLEEFESSKGIYDNTLAALRTNQQLLPHSTRMFKDWSVSLMHRFGRDDVGHPPH